MRKILIFTVLCIITVSAWAVPARKGGIVVIQPDGSKITIHQHGDESFHWITNEKGEWLKQEADGFYQVIDSMSVQKAQSRRKASTIQPQQRLGKLNIAPRGLVILVNYQDVQFSTADKAEMDSMLNGENYSRDYSYTYLDFEYRIKSEGSARKYFYDASYGQYNPQFDVVGPVTVSKNMAYYGENDRYGDDKNAELMVAEACELVDDSVDFSVYDSDNDGEVDFVCVIYAGYGEANGGASNTIWPHHSYVSYKINLQLDGKKINDYVCCNEINYYSKQHEGIGTFCHEFSHILGLPDLYATNDAEHKTLGIWDIMASGSYNNYGNTPPTYSAYERFFMGWVTPRILVDSENVVLQDLQETNTALLISTTDEHNMNGVSPSPATFYLIENRQTRGWDEHLPWHGMMLTKIQYNATKWNNNTVNNNASAMGVDLIEADRDNSIGCLVDGKPGDLFPCGAIEYLGIENHPIKNIKEKNGVITFSYKDAIPEPNEGEEIDENCRIYYSPATWIYIPEEIGTTTFGTAKLVDIDFVNNQGVLIFDRPVTSIPDTAFASYTISSVTIPNSVKNIGDKAFYHCTHLTSINIPDSVKSIGNDVFYDCSSLKSITLPYSITSIGERTFSNCSSLKSITLPNSITSIGEGAFSNCSSLESITLPNSITSIGHSAFYNCSSLKSITLPNSVTSIGMRAFDCPNLTSVTWNAKRCTDLTDYTYYPFGYDGKIKTFVFGDSVEHIPAHLCYNLNSITSVTIPNSVTSIGYAAFGACDSLKTITIGRNVSNFGDHVFTNCSSLSTVFWNAKKCTDLGSEPFKGGKIRTFVFGDSVEYIPAMLCSFLDSITSITIPNSVTSIGERAFDCCSSLKSITLPNSITSIGEQAFRQCESLTSITIPNSVTSIGDGAFAGCKGLTSITIPNSVTSLGNSAFADCDSLKTVTIGSNVSNCGKTVFGGCNALSTVFWNSKQCTDFEEEDPWGNSKIETLVFGDSVEYIPARLCASEYIRSLTIPNNVKSIGDWAFSYCRSLDTVMIGNGVTTIGRGAFYQCTSLDTVSIGNSVTSIGQSAFMDCKSLTSIDIPNSVTSLGNSAFLQCDSLKTIAIGCNVSNFGEAVFSNCYSISSVFWNVKQCADFTGNIWNTIAIENFVFGDSVEYIPAFLCNRQKSITSITIPTSVTSIGTKAFYDCDNLEKITCHAETPPVLGDYAFYRTYYLMLYVPCGTVSAYKEADGWKAFRNILEPEITYSVEVLADKAFGTASVDKNTSCETQISAKPATGYAFAQWSDGNTDNPRTLILTQDTVLTAEFTVKSYTISTKPSNPERGETAGDTTVNYSENVTISATPYYGYYFSKWNDSNKENPRTVQVTSDKTYTAYFEPNTYSITKQCNSEQGTIDGVSSAKYLNTVILTAKPNEGYYFSQWSDGVVDNPRTFVITQDTTFAVEFTTKLCTISTKSSDSERGETIGDTIVYSAEYITISAIPYYGYYFARWNDSNKDNPRTVKVISDKTYTAYFEKNTYSITKQCNSEHGTINGVSSAKYLNTVILTAKPNEGYYFSQWSDGVVDNPRTFIITQDTTFAAEFTINTYEVIINENEYGTTIGAGVYNYGDEVTLIATPHDGFSFSKWSNGVTDNPYIFIIMDNVTLSVEFDKISSVENTNIQSQQSNTRKLFRDGQLLILRDGKTYNVMGQEL